MAIKHFIKLIRPKQWYKNLVIFLPLIFAQQLFVPLSLWKTVIGFAALSLISSTNYILNDMIDKERDRKNPEKKSRPLASGDIRIWEAMILAVILAIGGIYLSYLLSPVFLGLALLLFVSTQLYTFWLKREPFADILTISINFVIRTVSGAFVITKGLQPYVEVSPWLILTPFFIALFLATGKRRSEFFLLKGNRKAHREVLEAYDNDLTWALLIISTTLLVMSYSLYTFFSPYPLLILTLPFVLYLIFRFFYLVKQNSPIARHPELLYRDWRTVIALIITTLIAIASIYFL